MPHQWIDLEEDEEADALLRKLAVEPNQTPVVIASGGEILRNPSNAELGRTLGLGSTGSPPALCDVVVVGAGPAGIAASLYAASEGLDTLGSRQSRPAVKLARRPRSRTTSVSRPGYRAASWLNELGSRRRSSARAWPYRQPPKS
jgi:NADPH-dependent 2,4-dienoyl-CoA reductase/sulfur reductase-like enzyme